MGFLDFFKNLFKKKAPPLISPSEMPQQQPTTSDGQFQTPQNTANQQEQNPPPANTQPPGSVS